MIDKEEFEKSSFKENQKLIKEILRLVTHNAFTKADLLLLIKWQNAIIEKMKSCFNCKYFCGGIGGIFYCKLDDELRRPVGRKEEVKKAICNNWELVE